jgi:hypothetical protein
LVKEVVVGSCPSEAHSGGWEGLGEEGWKHGDECLWEGNFDLDLTEELTLIIMTMRTISAAGLQVG